MPSEAGLQRLHPLSLLFLVGRQAKSLLLPGILVLFFASSQGHGQIWFMLLFIPAVVGTLLRYGSYRYRLGPDELLIREGVVFRNERHIPYARIQNIDLVQNPLHRLFRVAEIRLETAGGHEPEAVLCVLSLGAVQRMRTRIFSGRTGPAAQAQTAGAVLHALGLRDVFLFGLISNKGMVVVAAALGLVWQLDLVERWTSIQSRESLERYRALIPQDDFLVTGLLGLAALVTLVVFMRLLSVIWAVAKFQGFRLTRSGDDLRAEYGLLTRVSKTIPRNRIQVVSTREGVLHRRFGRVAVQVETAGSTGADEGPSANRLWLAPLIHKERVAALLREALPQVDFDAVRWQAISAGARRRLFRKACYEALPITAGALYFFGAWGLLVPVLLLSVCYWTSGLYVKHTGYAVVPGAIFSRSGWWVRRLRIVRFSKIQALETTESPFDRRYRMASLKVDTAGATRVGHSIDMPYLDVGVAKRMQNQLYDEAGRTAFRW